MHAVADIGVAARPPIVGVRSAVVGEIAAVRAVVTRVVPGVGYVVRFRVRAGTAAGSGCITSASAGVRPSGGRVRVALVPRGAWCPGVGVLTAVAVRRGAVVGTARVLVRPAQALGRGDVVGRLRLGPTCPVARADDPCDPVPRPSPLTLVALDASGAETARTVTLSDGSFAFDLAAGNYTLRAAGAGAALPRIAATRVTVTPQATRSRPRRVVVPGDTGIR